MLLFLGVSARVVPAAPSRTDTFRRFSWNGISHAELKNERAFTNGLLRHVCGSSGAFAGPRLRADRPPVRVGNDEAKTIRMLLAGSLANELVAIYGTMIGERRWLHLDEILAATVNERRYLETPEHVLRGLAWLQTRWWPLLPSAQHKEARWSVAGPKKCQVEILEPSQWPDGPRSRWAASVGDRSAAAFAIRAESVMAARRLRYADLSEVLPRYRGKENRLRTQLSRWRRNRVDRPSADQRSEWGQMLGVSASALGRGVAGPGAGGRPAAHWKYVLRRIAGESRSASVEEQRRSRGARLRRLRRVRDLTMVELSLAAAGAVSTDLIGKLERSGYQRLQDPANWRRLARALDVDVFVLLSGLPFDEVASLRSLGEQIELAREARGLTIEALAELAGVSRKTVLRWTHDEATPRPHRLAALAQQLGGPDVAPDTLRRAWEQALDRAPPPESR